MNELPVIHKVIGYVGSLVLLVTVMELVRRRRLSIRYSVFWVLSAFGTLGLTVFYSKIMIIVTTYDIKPISLAFFLAIMFLTLVSVYTTVRITTFERMLKDIGQELAMVELKIEDEGTQGRRDALDTRKAAADPVRMDTPLEG